VIDATPAIAALCAVTRLFCLLCAFAGRAPQLELVTDAAFIQTNLASSGHGCCCDRERLHTLRI